ncbi:glycosyltransferase family 2 protein [bacterium]|nr:glycosyltransferase family 2 protein [bacterium]
MHISIVIPVYNGARTIGGLVNKLISILEKENLQVILVNDGSADNSRDVCISLVSQYPSIVRYVELAKNFGEHNAVMAGLHYADGDYVVIMDDDFQNPPEEVPRIIQKAAGENLDIVFTQYTKKEHNWFRNLGSIFNDKMANVLLKKPKGLYLSSFKCLSRFAVKETIKYAGPYPYIDGLALRCTRRIGVIQVRHDKRMDGRSGYTIRKLVNLLTNMLVNFSVSPLRISFLLGIVFSILGLFLSVMIVIERIANPALPIGWASLAIMIIIFSGVQLFILGLLGEYLGRMFLGSNQTPQFIVREVHQGSISGEATCEKRDIQNSYVIRIS